MIHPDKVQLLADECGNLKSAMTHLFFSMERTRGLVPRIREELSLEELERLESLASRFARLADMLIQRLMRLIDEVELAPPGTVLDRMALLRFVWAWSLAQMRVVSDWSIRNRLEGTCG